ncbi:hypothetical protein IFM46972_03254 [Aspergillus udagawae]|uniref:Uncharacterized protein n=1 Tax=Aspergillus udagawae TaxID=91492 RepID=A0A8H3NKC6_9EURO|nr:hypothetical protein IFM46972_03254 [Aspergillus udagawae]
MRTELVHFLTGPGRVNHRKSLEEAIQDATDTRVQFVVWPYPSMRITRKDGSVFAVSGKERLKDGSEGFVTIKAIFGPAGKKAEERVCLGKVN